MRNLILAIAALVFATGAVAQPAPLYPPASTVNGVAPDSSGNITISTTNFVIGFTSVSPGLKANLPTCGVTGSTVGMYAVVSDLNSALANTNEVMRCGQTGSVDFWYPVRPNASLSMATPTAALSLIPNVTPPIIHFTGTSGTGSATVTPSTVGAYPGETFTIVQDGILGLFSLQIGGLLGGALNMVTGGTRVLTYSCTATTVSCSWVGN